MKAFRIAYWPRADGNPYQDLFYNALHKYEIQYSYSKMIDDSWLMSQKDTLDAFHFHWPEAFWRTRGKGHLGQLRGVAGLYNFLRLAKTLKKKLIWTVHNLEDHNGVNWIDRIAYHLLAKSCDLLICHDQSAVKIVRQKYSPPGTVIMVPHGNYDGCYPPPRSFQIVREELGLNVEKPVIGCFGIIRNYKGFDLVAQAISELGGEVQLLIGGVPHTTFDINILKKYASNFSYIRLLERHLSNQEFSDYICACDGVVFPYRKITSSGALLAALTLGRGVIVSDLPLFREVCNPEPDAVCFFSPTDKNALKEAIRKFISIPSFLRNSAARRLAGRYSWDNTVRSVEKVIGKWRSRVNY